MTSKNPFSELRKESQSIFNRIHSIAEDAAFVNLVHERYLELPLLPNMRCGAWYTDPRIVHSLEQSAYFKSTDGHTNNWIFNLRRPNLHILCLIARHAGLVLVDSTRAGKRIPDALSKTVPIWCAVINRAILIRAPENHPSVWDTALYTPPGCVSPQEHSQIEAKLDAWAAQLAASSYSFPTLHRPLRPIWTTPATTVFPTFSAPPDFYPIICVSASKQVTDGMERRASGFSYIQGSGDDHELWSMGLTPPLYWKHRDELLTTTSSELPDLVRSLVPAVSASCTDDATADPDRPLCTTPIKHVLGRISISTITSLRRPNLLQAHPTTAFVCLTPHDLDSDEDPTSASRSRLLRIQTVEGKRGQHNFLAVVLPRAIPFVQHHLLHHCTVCVACSTGTDASVGVVVAALAMFFHPDGSLCARGNARADMSKDILKTRLQWIIASCPQANPSRTTLKRVNDYLLSPFSNASTLGVLDEPDHGNADDTHQEAVVTRACKVWAYK